MSKGFKEAIKAPPAMEVEVEKMKPRMCLDSSDYPEVKDWDLDKEYTIVVRGVSRTEDDKGHIHMDVELVKTQDSGAKKDEEMGGVPNDKDQNMESSEGPVNDEGSGDE